MAGAGETQDSVWQITEWSLAAAFRIADTPTVRLLQEWTAPVLSPMPNGKNAETGVE
jgi:hypothetical protein